MIDVKCRRCEFDKCMIRACFNYENEKIARFCYEHKLENMENIKGKKCIYEGCKTQPVYGYIADNKPIYCSKHKQETMIDVVSKKCEYKECINKPIYNYEGETKSKYCSIHKNENMINVISKKCEYEGCNTIPNYNYTGKTNAVFCFSHKKTDMIDIKHPKCKSEYCQTYSNKIYKGYCCHCYQNLFPDDILTIQMRNKSKEMAVRDFINTKFEGFQHDKPLWYNESACDCTTKRRIDHRKLINGTLLCIETDENQHKGYSKQDEESRYHDLFMAYGGKFVFIRFNPDKYKDENGKSCNPMLFNRLIVLEEEINKHIKRIENDENNELLEVVELYYDKK